VSTQGPASYGLGTSAYEENIIKDCFGAERINEYKGKGNLDVIIVYGCTGSVLEQVKKKKIKPLFFFSICNLSLFVVVVVVVVVVYTH
jgi:t-SNARE complex subunit (syntaxin)